MNELTADQLRALMAQQTTEVVLSFLKVEHASLDEPLRLVCNFKPITRADGTYEPCAFDAPSPQQTEDQAPSTQLTIDNTDLTVNKKLRKLVGAPTVTLFTALASDPDSILEGPFVFSLQMATGDMNNITGTLGYDARLFEQNFPAQTYTPVNSPGLFS